jgi:cytochrome c oxidase subunit 2
MSVSKHKKPLLGLVAMAMLLVAGPALAELHFNFQEPVSPNAHEIMTLHMRIFWICVVIAIGVFSVMFYSMFKHRKSKGAVPATFHENTKVEVLWTVIPFLILIFVAVPATKALLTIENTSGSDLTVKVTGMQWKWKYEYVDNDNDPSNNVSFISSLVAADRKASESGDPAQIAKVPHYLQTVDHELVLPVGKKIRFLVTGADVIHSFYVPSFGVKKDAIPGYVNETWTEIQKPGTYRGDCAELCGQDHAFMPIVVKAVSDADFKTWLAKKKAEAEAAAAEADSNKVWTLKDLYAKGDKIFHGKGGCHGCHGENGQGNPPVFPPLKGSKIATGPVKDHIHLVLNGKPGTAMAAYRDQLNDLELAAVITYERNAWGNNTGDVVQPADIKAAR